MGTVREEEEVEEAYASPMEVQVAIGSGGNLLDLACVKVAYRMVVGEGEVEREDLDEIVEDHQLNGP